MKRAAGPSTPRTNLLLRLVLVVLSATAIFVISCAAHQSLMGSLLVSLLSMPPALEVIDRYIGQRDESRK